MAGKGKPGVTANSERIEEIRTSIKRAEAITGAALRADQYAPAVQAQLRATKLRAELDDIVEAARIAEILDPVLRLEAQQQRAMAAGSWVAAAQLGNRLEEARIQAAAARAAKAERAARDPARMVEAGVAQVCRLPESLLEQWFALLLRTMPPGVRERGIAPYVLGAKVETRRLA